MRVLILGSTGLLGQVLMKSWGSDVVIGAGSQDADVRDRTQLQKLFADSQPDWTVLAAAYTDVDGCEKDPQRAHDVNCGGAINVAEAARDAGSRLLFISSDYVFDGSKAEPYQPEDRVCPVSVYGAAKAGAECGIRQILTECCIVRTSWVFGANGRCFPNTILDLARSRKKVSVVDDQKGCPTFNRDLAQAIRTLVRAGAQGTLHATNRDECTWFEFACELVRRAGMTEVEVTPVSTKQFPRPAPRPAYSVLSPAG